MGREKRGDRFASLCMDASSLSITSRPTGHWCRRPKASYLTESAMSVL